MPRNGLSALKLLDLRKEVPQVRGHGALGQPEREHGSKQSALEPREVSDSKNVYSTPAFRGLGIQLPCAPRFEEVGVEHGSPNRPGLRPVVAQAFPDVSDWPGIALGDDGEVLAPLVDLEVRYMHIGPQLCPSLREVPRSFEDLLGT